MGGIENIRIYNNKVINDICGMKIILIHMKKTLQ